LRKTLLRYARSFIKEIKMVKLHSSEMFINDPVDMWGKEHTIGNAELAARLGSPITFDRRGTIWWYDTFDNSAFAWKKTLFGTGASATLSNEYPYVGDGCAKIVHGNTLDDYTIISKNIGSAATSRIGISAVLNYTAVTNISCALAMKASTGTRIIGAAVRVKNNSLSYGNSTGMSFRIGTEFTEFDATHELSSYSSLPLKFVIDVDKEKYVRCMISGDEIDMTGYTPCVTAYGGSREILPHLVVVNIAGAANNTAYFDNVVLTVEEPE